MSTDKHRFSAPASGSDAAPGQPLGRVLEHAPTAFAVTRGSTHSLLFANAAFRAIAGLVGNATEGTAVAGLFDASVANRLTEFLDRALRDNCSLRARFLGPLEPAGRPWNCTVWPLPNDDGAPQGLVIELSAATPAEVAVSLQREVAERLLLSALRQSEAIEDAEASLRRASFLASSGRQLAESLDTETTQKTVAALILPALAAWCIVDLLKDDDTAQRLTIVHRDASKQALISQLDSRWLPKPGDPFGLPAVLDNAQPVLVADNVDDALAAAAHGFENLRVLRELGIGPLLTLPLIADMKVFGAITFVSGERDGAFSAADIELAEGLAARSALALHNARLYGQTLMLKNKAEDAARTATTFLGTISHEVRTPLNAIFGYVDLIRIHGPVTAAQQLDLERVSINVRHLMVLIGELLNYMRVGSGRVSYEAVSVSLCDAVTGAVESMEPLLVEKNLTCKLGSAGTEVCASADPDSVHQILINLISNAIKFTNAGGEITIECSATDAHAITTVTDSGRGIPADKLEIIFEPFVQAHDDDARRHGGVGLGLPISRDLARAMHGDLTVESRLGAGATFTLSLPAAL